MNKLLTTIVLLCFSIAANAEILFCTPQGLSYLAPDDITDIQYFNRDAGGNEVFIVDTEKGFRQERDDDYRGSCEIIIDSVPWNGWICNAVREQHQYETLLITDGRLFTYSHHFGVVTIAPIVASLGGRCTKA
jgi:hypothetical protein